MAERPKGPDESASGPRSNPATSPAAGSTGPATGPDRPATGTVREAVGVFDSAEALQAALDDLAMAGFRQHELSLMADDDSLLHRLGRVPRGLERVKDDPATPRTAPVAPEDVGDAQGAAIGIPAYVGALIATGAVVASGGTALAAALAAAAAGGAGGGLGAVLAKWIGSQREQTLRQHLAKGGLVLWANLRDREMEAKAVEIMGRHAARPVEVHDVPQVTA